MNLPSLHKSLLGTPTRLDGRTTQEFVSFDVSLGKINTAEGSSVIRVGSTMVTCGVKLKTAAPPADNPHVGWLVANIDLPPLCASRFRPGPPSEEAQAMSQWLQDVLIASACPRLSELVVVPGRVSFCVHVDVVVTNCDGCLRDACLLAAVTALQNTRLPRVEFKTELDSLVILHRSGPKLDILRRPMAVTWALGQDNLILCNPTDIEEREYGGLLTIVLDADDTDRILALDKLGGSSITSEVISQCVERAMIRCSELTKQIDTIANDSS